ncbi:MAG: hypothetical protein NTY98_17895 [Verrucomicrobia bacterium]|nr:hypothetical protein [Verrucomicrobiota bacterium]
MNCRLPSLVALIAAILPPTANAEDDFPLKREELHALIREAASKVEAQFKATHPEAAGLVERVEETLAMSEPAPPAAEDRLTMLAQKLTLMNSEAGFKSMIGGVRGAVFDNTDTGNMQRYQDLDSASTQDEAEVWRWLEMADAAQRLKWQDKTEICTQRALGAARALVSREPKNAEAHALLGLALEWNSEKLTALQTALKLDPKQPLALNELLERRLDQALEAAALRRETSLEEKPKASQELIRALFDRPLTDEEALIFGRRQKELQREITQLLTLAQERNDLTTFLKTVNLHSQLRQQRGEVNLVAKRGPDENYEMFQARLGALMADGALRVFEEDALLQSALKLAAADPESMGTIILMALVGDAMLAQASRQQPTEARMEIMRQTFARLDEMAGANESPQAARAAEGAFVMELGMTLLLNRPAKRLDLLLRAVHLDPFRQRTQHMLLGLCAGMLSKSRDSAAAAALAQTELALLPNQQTRRTCAAAAAMVHDWPTAQRHLDACLKEEPDDLGLLNQKAVTFLRESQSKAAQKKAAVYFHKIESLHDKPDTNPNQADLKITARNHILFLMISGKNDAAREELTVVQREKILDEQECQDLGKLLP